MQHPKCCTKNLTVFKFDLTSSNMLQHIATGWPNVRNMLCPTMLQDVALKCCERLARPLYHASIDFVIVVGDEILIDGSKNAIWPLALEDEFRGNMKIPVRPRSHN